ncbi:MAG: nucleotidyltransferase family protein [Eubacterium sp.]|nr:nucleotidyltransferase family protein [Eubacterium sp.]
MPKQTWKETEYLLHLVCCVLHSKEPKKAQGVDFCALFELAKEQEIYNLINGIVQAADFVDKEAKELFRNQSMSELNRMIAISSQRSILLSKLSENKINHMLLKGLILKDYYPKESMRQMSDNDILIDEKRRNDAAEIMYELGYEAEDLTQNSDDFFKEPYYAFELHRSLFDSESEFSPRFDNVWKNAKQDENNEYLYHMSKEDVYIFSICHMFKHYIKSCCGIRFLIDNYLFLEKEKDNLNWDYINGELEKNGLSDYEKQSRELSKKLFEEKELDESDKKLLENYINYGLFGNKQGRIIQDYSKSKNKFSYILRRLFPKKKDMIFNYPVLEKKPYLFPFMLIHRFFKGLFNIKKTSDELKSVNSINKEN